VDSPPNLSEHLDAAEPKEPAAPQELINTPEDAITQEQIKATEKPKDVQNTLDTSSEPTTPSANTNVGETSGDKALPHSDDPTVAQPVVNGEPHKPSYSEIQVALRSQLPLLQLFRTQCTSRRFSAQYWTCYPAR